MKQVYRYLHYLFWRLNGGLPNGYVKQFILRKAFKTNDFYAFIETGTHRGQMVAAFRDVAPAIYSVELSDSYAQAAKKRFKGLDHVRIIQGNSAEQLPLILNQQHGPSLIWLDAHYSGGDTAKGAEDSPISQEIKAVLESPYRHFVCIDDARCFDGSDGYPSIAELKLMLRTKYMLEVKADVIFCYPKSLE